MINSDPKPLPAFERRGPSQPQSPVVLSVPHAGRAYSNDLLARARVPREALEWLEDRHSDQLVTLAVAEGASALIAHAPRAEIDLNRDIVEIDPRQLSPPAPVDHSISQRALCGLGLVPHRLAGIGALWRTPLDRAELSRRVETVHRPYHTALTEMLEAARDRFGIAILLDCHSMPPSDAAAAAIVFGDRYGRTIDPALLLEAEGVVANAGLTSRRNQPYAGGYITQRHGRPESGIHALQIEVDRALYLDARLRNANAGLERIQRLIAAIASRLADRALEPRAMAAE